MKIIYGDICETTCDAIVNASNGIGFMGGKAGIRKKLKGVAETIHFNTGGKVEQEAKKICRAHSVWGYAPGKVFVTGAANLNSKYIIHAVTMWYPGTFSTLSTVKKLLPAILEQARLLGVHSVALPLLGTGTGGVSEKKVMELYDAFFGSVQDIEMCVYIYKKK